MTKILIAITLLTILGCGCQNHGPGSRWDRDNIAQDACIKQGGIPITNFFGWLKHCEYKR